MTQSRTLRRVRTVAAQPGYRLHVSWADGTSSSVDFANGLLAGGVFEALRDPGLFARVRVGDRERTVEWTVPNGTSETRLDIDADALFVLSEPLTISTSGSAQTARG